jgi:hypothetical protein
MAKFALLLRDSGAFPPSGVSPEDLQAILQRYMTWSREHAVGGEKLYDGEGRVVRRDAVTDGPFAESREVIGGFFLIEADDYDHAQRLVADCPQLDFGSIEIRRIEAM